MKKKKGDENKKEEIRTREEGGKEKSIVEGFLGKMPILGDLVKSLSKTEIFKERFKEIDKEIEEKLKKGEKKKWGFEANISIRPIINEIRQESSEITIGKDYFYGEKDDKLTLAVKVPKEDVDLKIKGVDLIIKSDKFVKKLELPDYFKDVKKKRYKNGILLLELTK